MKGFSTIFILGFICFSKLSFADTLTITSDLWCPYSCEENSDHQGFMVEIAKAIFEPKGHKIQYKIVNWARAVQEAKAGKANGVLGANRGDVPGFILPSLAIGNSANYFWALKDSKFNYQSIELLKDKKIGVINGYSYGGDEIDLPIQKKNKSFVVVSGDKALSQLIKMAAAKRIDAFIENPNVLQYVLSTMPEYKDKFQIVSKNMGSDPDLFIAFSPANPNSKKYADLLSEGMKTIRKNGKLKAILARYGMVDWQK